MMRDETELHAVIEVVRRHAVPLDLETAAERLLDAIDPNASLVLIGEATHGTHEFYRIRADLTRALIQRRGFVVVARAGRAQCRDLLRAMCHGNAESWHVRDRHMMTTLETLLAHAGRSSQPARAVGAAREAEPSRDRSAETPKLTPTAIPSGKFCSVMTALLLRPSPGTFAPNLNYFAIRESRAPHGAALGLGQWGRGFRQMLRYGFPA